jgi:tetratricopeptide (TPR) repeat protein
MDTAVDTSLINHARGMRLRMLVLLAVALALGALLLKDFDRRLSMTPSPAELDAMHTRQRVKAEVEERFRQGVVMLHAKRYNEAATAFHRVLKLSPEMPEAHVNMGFTLLGLKEYKAARDFFEGAIALKRNQLNAYFGLAIALEGLQDLRGARGAMRTYLHLAPAEDKYRRKAESAIWEWGEALELAEKGQAGEAAPLQGENPQTVAPEPAMQE